MRTEARNRLVTVLTLQRSARLHNNRTRAVIINSPNNPTGKVFSRQELEAIAALCRQWDAVAISDEIYEHILHDGRQHIPIATIDGMAERPVTINGLSKAYRVTGWRVGWTISPPSLTGSIRKVHDFLTVGAPAPLQEAGVVPCPTPPRSRAQTPAGRRRMRRCRDGAELGVRAEDEIDPGSGPRITERG